MAVKKRKAGVSVALVLVAVILGLLFQNLWTFNYNPRPVSEMSIDIPTVRADVDVSYQPINGMPVPCANLHLTNSGKGRLRLVDTVSPDPLYNLLLVRVLPNGGSESIAMSGQRMMLSGKLRSYYDSSKDSEVVLLPGRTVTVRFPLHDTFNMDGVAGKFRLNVQYRPQALMDLLPPEQTDRPTPDTIMVNCQTEFEMPLRAPEAQPVVAPPAGKPKPAPASTPVETPAPKEPTGVP
jgi:hypothetical protein